MGNCCLYSFLTSSLDREDSTCCTRLLGWASRPYRREGSICQSLQALKTARIEIHRIARTNLSGNLHRWEEPEHRHGPVPST
jgi:hypothetical protein